MTKDQFDRLAVTLANAQTSGGSLGDGMAPFTVQFGYVDTICRHDGAVIKDAPPALVAEVTAWAAKQQPPVYVSVAYGGLLVR